MAAARLERLRRRDLGQLEELLVENGLPSEDCAEQAEHFYALLEHGRLVAAGGLQPAGEYFLLRSLVVATSHRGRGLGRRITGFLLELAREAGSPAVYLLTESAAGYFTELGFVPVERAQVPAAIAGTRQFASLCPDSASCLAKELPAA